MDKEVVSLVEETSQSYMEYALSTIIARALPDIRDGLKPVQRRIIYAMLEDGLVPSAPYVKSVSIVGDTLKKYHPHGDQTVYGTLVNMEQPFNFRYPLVDGQGNFGSVNDPQSPAAPRYTEAKMTNYCLYCTQNVNDNIVNFLDNFDGRYKEPEVLPVPFPNLLCNGSIGIAVGMSTNIPPHNLGEVIDATIALIKKPNIQTNDLMKHIQGPDFPSGGYILGVDSIKEVYNDGKGAITLQAKISIEERVDGGKNIIINELPYRVSPDRIEIKISELASKEDNPISDIIDVKNLTDSKLGTHVVIELKKNANSDIVLERLFNETDLRTIFYIDMKVIDGNAPRVASLKSILQSFIDFRIEVVTKLLQNKLGKAEAAIHLQGGLAIILDGINKAVDLIQKASNRDEASKVLQKEFKLSFEQTDNVLNMPLSRLTKLGKKNIQEEMKSLQKEIDKYKNILSTNEKIKEYIIQELKNIKTVLADSRRSKIILQKPDVIQLGDLVGEEQVVITVTKDGYIKKTSLNEYKIQKKGGTGALSLNAKEEDKLQDICIAKMNQDILFFTNSGTMYRQKIHRVPQVTRAARGIHINNLLTTDPEESVKAILIVDDDRLSDYLLLVTTRGKVKKTLMQEYSLEKQRKSLNAFSLSDGDEVCKILQVADDEDILILTNDGMVVRYPIKEIRASGRRAMGAQGITLSKGAFVVNASSVAPTSKMFMVIATQNGYGKKTNLTEYGANSNRGGKGVKAIDLKPKDFVVGMVIVHNKDQIILMTSGGKLLRHQCEELKETGRVTRGVFLMHLKNETLVDIAKIIEGQECNE